MNWVLGIWDGHDAGCALIRGDEVVFAINEERLSRRKLEIGFPHRALRETLRVTGLTPRDLQHVAVTTGDFAKTLSRLFPSLQEQYYQIRRRKSAPGAFMKAKKMAKYRMTLWPSTPPSRALSLWNVKRNLGALGIRPERVELVDHHDAHAIAAAACSGFGECLVLTLDGIGDGLSGSMRVFRNGRFVSLAEIDGKSSFGIFYEHATQLLNMRELEDEGKVMAMAACTTPVADEQNPLLRFFAVEGLSVRAAHGPVEMFHEMAKVLWRWPSEQFAYMVQRTVEAHALELVRNALKRSGMRRLAYAGGVASNVKLNMLFRELPEVDELFVFPHMGDGGQAMGAAMWANAQANGICRYPFPHVYFGPGFSDDETRQAIEGALNQQGNPRFGFEKPDDLVERAADLISQGEILAWFSGKMEFGPRALGARSILALPNSKDLRDELNLRLKKRSWYQPYCPVMLEGDAKVILQDFRSREPFMTCTYRTVSEHRSKVEGVVGPDGTCRPQVLGENEEKEGPYRGLLQAIRRRTGQGVLLNTSFNLHGEPIVCTPSDAVRTFVNSEFRCMVLNDYLLTKN